MSAVPTSRPCGFMEHGEFVPVPRVPLTLAGLAPPVTVELYFGPRHIIEQPTCPSCNAPGARPGECHPCRVAADP